MTPAAGDLARISDDAVRTWRRDGCGLLAQGREDGDVTVATADDVLAEQLLAMATGLQVLATLPEAPTPATTQLAMLDAFLAGLVTRWHPALPDARTRLWVARTSSSPLPCVRHHSALFSNQ